MATDLFMQSTSTFPPLQSSTGAGLGGDDVNLRTKRDEVVQVISPVGGLESQLLAKRQLAVQVFRADLVEADVSQILLQREERKPPVGGRIDVQAHVFHVPRQLAQDEMLRVPRVAVRGVNSPGLRRQDQATAGLKAIGDPAKDAAVFGRVLDDLAAHHDAVLP